MFQYPDYFLDFLLGFHQQCQNSESQLLRLSQHPVSSKLTLSQYSLLSEKGFRIHQCPFGFGDEVRQILPRLQADFEDSPPRKGKVDHHRQQHAAFEVRTN